MTTAKGGKSGDDNPSGAVQSGRNELAMPEGAAR